VHRFAGLQSIATPGDSVIKQFVVERFEVIGK
jgi:hypothetical protein